jgi:hypothetical protein
MLPEEKTMIELSQEQRQGLAGPEPARAIDPETKETYVLVREEIYDRIKALFVEEDGNRFVGDLYADVIAVFGRAGWDDPAMDIYNEFDPRKNPFW